MKRIIIFAVILMIGILLLFSSKSIVNFSSKSFWNIIITQLDKEEKERLRKIENGDVVRGKDTALIWHNKFEIWNNLGEKHLSIKTNNSYENIVENIYIYKIVKKKLYIISEEGYAIINENNVCRAYITVPDDEFVNGYSTDENGNKHYNSRYIEDEHINYLSDFNDFTENEQKVFKRLEDK